MPRSLPIGNLKKRAIEGGAISLTARMASLLVQAVGIAVLSRLLPAADFGIIAMIAAVTAFVGLFRDLGLSTAAIQTQQLTRAQMSLLFWLNVAAGTVLMLLTAACAPFIGWFYGKPELQPVVLLLASTFLISSLGAQHSALLQRELRFMPKAVADIGGALVSLLLAVALAVNGLGYWALAWGIVAGSLTTTILYALFSGFTPGMPRRTGGIRQLLGFGFHVTAFEFVNYFHRNLDSILIGRIWGAAALGLYSRAYQMMMLPIAALRAPINAVALPVLSGLQDDPVAYRLYYRKITSVLAFLSMPLMAFLVVNARGVVIVVLGEEWTSLVPVFVLLGLSGFIQPVAGLRGLVMLSLGRSGRYLAWGAANAAAVTTSFAIGVAWGSIGVAAAYALCNYLILYPSMRFLFSDTPVTPADFVSSTAVPACASIFAGAVNLLVNLHLPESGPVVSVILALLVFAPAFLLFLLTFPSGRDTLNSYRNLLQSLNK